MPNLATLNALDTDINGEALGMQLGAKHWMLPTASVVSEEYDQLDSPWHNPRPAEPYRTKSVLVSVPGKVPLWVSSVLERITNLSQLEHNWDSYGAVPVQLPAIFYAVNLMASFMTDETPIPSIVPTTSGGIQIEWHAGGIDFEIEVMSDGILSVFYEDERDAGQNWEDDFTYVKGMIIPRLIESVGVFSERVG